MKRPTRRTILLSLLGFIFLCSALCGLSLLLAPDATEREPTAQAAAAVEGPATIADDPEAASTAPPSTARATATPRPSRTPTAEPPTVAPTKEPATAAPSRTPRPSATPAPTAAPSRTPTPLPLPTAAPVPPTAAPTSPPPAPTAAPSGEETAVVTNVVDGDTIDVSINGAGYRVRYIGMDTPETGATCGAEATAANAALVSGQTVRLVRDVSETDRYGRLLRYVYVGDTFVNGALVAGGWADAVDYPPDTAQSGTLHSLMAQGAGRGCDLVAAPLPTQPVRAPEATVPLEPAPTSPPPAGNCHPSYPGVCIPPPPPDLDCGDIPYRRFQVVGDDPHRFDGDGNGIGCESG